MSMSYFVQTNYTAAKIASLSSEEKIRVPTSIWAHHLRTFISVLIGILCNLTPEMIRQYRYLANNGILSSFRLPLGVSDNVPNLTHLIDQTGTMTLTTTDSNTRYIHYHASRS